MSHGTGIRPGVPYRRPGGTVDRLVLESEPTERLPIDERSVNDWRERVHPDDRDRLCDALSDEEVDIAYRVRTEESNTWITERGVQASDDETIVGYLFPAGERVERRRRLERQRERLEEFVGVVSHDLRNPLSIAVGNLELARDLEGEQATERLDRVHEALERMDTLIADMLALAREGRIVEETAEADVERIVRQAWSTTGTGAPARLVIEDPLPRVPCDDRRLRRVFENLFRNAIEHGVDVDDPIEHVATPETLDRDSSTVDGPDELQASGGSMDVVRVVVGPTADGFYIDDDGPGIPPDRREQILEPGHSTRPDGTGFGLAIVERIVTAHGWEIEVTESRFGGARFEVTDVETVTDAE
ncbi:sensor histidine kinase [Halorubrum vacuolatum]|uniref:histidine kinase n=1 Tax=Halorubrum vacuolatum TaxID=63740 RepID=A0A238UQN6_HALVU|nr:HAMP domain-containing sensor histidine kinase [Halorubrum vacuolatum]SNR24460.1 Histidine kinase-, DNA gyrase B-, and HSP90-like ATPase [Halorubrum vacuolatum]